MLLLYGNFLTYHCLCYVKELTFCNFSCNNALSREGAVRILYLSLSPLSLYLSLPRVCTLLFLVLLSLFSFSHRPFLYHVPFAALTSGVGPVSSWTVAVFLAFRVARRFVTVVQNKPPLNCILSQLNSVHAVGYEHSVNIFMRTVDGLVGQRPY